MSPSSAGRRFLAVPLALAGLLRLRLTFAAGVQAQESASFRLSEFALNSGGHPADGVSMSSTSFRISLDALGQGVSGLGLAGGGFSLEGGFVPPYVPPGEVATILFTAQATLDWEPAPAASAYNLYRGELPVSGSPEYGTCTQPDLATPVAVDSEAPVAGAGFIYLVTAVNRLHEEGTRGFDTEGVERNDTELCP